MLRSPAALFLVLVSVACRKSEWEPVEPATLGSAGQARLEAARTAVSDLGGRLKQDLLAALEAGGPGAAVMACQQIAPRIASEVGEERGLAIGRTSHRLRNSSNAAPAWAEATVRACVDEEQVWLGPGDRLGLLRPIPTAPLCLQCHGAPADLDPSAQIALGGSYPDDAATGFAVGDVRGYFWVEAP